MSRLQKYNNFIFAIFGTIILGATIFMLVSGIIEAQKRVEQSDFRDLMSPERLEERSEEDVPNQVVSFGAPILFMKEMLGLTIVPVRQTPQETGRSASKFASSAEYYRRSGDLGVSGSPVYWHRFGNHDNLLLKQNGSDIFEPLLEERGVITSYLILDKTTEPALVYFVALRDTDQDGRLTLDDRQELRIKSLVSDSGFRFDDQVESFAYVALPLQEEDSIVVFRVVDQNRDGRFDAERDPRHLVIVNVMTGEVRDYIDPELTERLQGLARGQ